MQKCCDQRQALAFVIALSENRVCSRIAATPLFSLNGNLNCLRRQLPVGV